MSPKFIRKFDEPKVTRAIRLTDTAWNNLAHIAQQQGKSRADLIETWMRETTLLPPTADYLEHHTQAIIAMFQEENQELVQLVLQKFIRRIQSIE